MFERDKKERNKIIDATIPPPSETKQTGYRTKHTVINQLSMHLGTLERVKRRRRRLESDERTEEDYKDLSTLTGGIRPESVRIVGSRDYQA